MIEADIEARVVARFRGMIADAGIEGIQVAGSLDVSDVRSIAEDGKTAYLVVKASPRSYSSPTIPECTIDCGVSLAVRADIDYSGRSYIALMEMILGVMDEWQQCLEEAHDDFTVDGFSMTGFVLGDGQTSIDQRAIVFEYTHKFTVFGVVNRQQTNN